MSRSIKIAPVVVNSFGLQSAIGTKGFQFFTNIIMLLWIAQITVHLFFNEKIQKLQATTWSTVLPQHHVLLFCKTSCPGCITQVSSTVALYVVFQEMILFSHQTFCREHPPVEDLPVQKTKIPKIGYLEVLWLYSNTGLQSAE